jgi:hypothetical protein
MKSSASARGLTIRDGLRSLVLTELSPSYISSAQTKKGEYSRNFEWIDSKKLWEARKARCTSDSEALPVAVVRYEQRLWSRPQPFFEAKILEDRL